jgi:hypothetical protein
MKTAILLTLLVTGLGMAAEPSTPAPAAKPAPASSSAVQDLQPAVDTSSVSPAPARPSPPASAPASAPANAVAPAATRPATGGRTAQDRLELDTTQITGNRELPKVLYIVPWKRADLGDLTGRPVNSLLDEVLAPVDRDVFRRQNRYYDALHPDTAPGGSGAARQEGEK